METHWDLLMTMMKEFDLVDVYREKNPKNKSYTYESKALKLCSRIDFFLLRKIKSVGSNR